MSMTTPRVLLAILSKGGAEISISAHGLPSFKLVTINYDLAPEDEADPQVQQAPDGLATVHVEDLTSTGLDDDHIRFAIEAATEDSQPLTVCPECHGIGHYHDGLGPITCFTCGGKKVIPLASLVPARELGDLSL